MTKRQRQSGQLLLALACLLLLASLHALPTGAFEVWLIIWLIAALCHR